MLVDSFFIAIIDVTNSGRDVPIAIIVVPITVSEILNLFANFILLSTTKFPPYFNSTIPITTRNID